MNRRLDGGTDHFVTAVTAQTMSFALKTSAKMVASRLATQGGNTLEPVTRGLPDVWLRVVSL